MSTNKQSRPSRTFMIGALLGIANHEIVTHVHSRLMARGFDDVTPAHRVVMTMLRPEGDRVTELAARAGMTKQSMGYLVDQLQAAGYVERTADLADGRATLVRRTSRGWEYNRAAVEEVANVQREWSRLIGSEKMRHLTNLLLELVSGLGHRYEGSVADFSTRLPGHKTRSGL